MKSTSPENLDLMEHLAVVNARQQRDQYLDQLDQLLESMGDEETSSIEELRRLFTTYEASDLPSLSAEIETMREER